MTNNDRLQQILSNVQKLSELANSMINSDMYPVFFFSQAFDLIQKLQGDFHTLEAEQVEMFADQLKKHQELILSIHQQMRNFSTQTQNLISNVTKPETPAYHQVQPVAPTSNVSQAMPVSQPVPPAPPAPPSYIQPVIPSVAEEQELIAMPVIIEEPVIVPPSPMPPEAPVMQQVSPAFQEAPAARPARPVPVEAPPVARPVPPAPPVPAPPVARPVPPAPPVARPVPSAPHDPPVVRPARPVPAEAPPAPPVTRPARPVPVEAPEQGHAASGIPSFLASIGAETPATRNEALASEQPVQSTINDAIEKKNLSDLRKAFSLNDHFRFRKELFNGSEEMMNKVINILNNKQSLKESILFLEQKLHWDFNDPNVKDFAKKLELRFL